MHERSDWEQSQTTVSVTGRLSPSEANIRSMANSYAMPAILIEKTEVASCKTSSMKEHKQQMLFAKKFR